MRLAWLFPLKARSPVAISWSSAPKAKMSARASGSLPSSCSGAMYWNVPMRLPSAAKGLSPVASALSSEAAATGVSGALSFASPKSSSFAPRLGEHDVSRLEIPVDDPVAMGLVKRPRDLDPVAQDLLEGK